MLNVNWSLFSDPIRLYISIIIISCGNNIIFATHTQDLAIVPILTPNSDDDSDSDTDTSDCEQQNLYTCTDTSTQCHSEPHNIYI